MLKKVKLLVFLSVFLFTFILRAHNYEKVPTPSHLDEQLYALSGINLIETGVPVSWSTLDYPKRAEVFNGKISYNGGEPSASVTLYKPWLDEPPLFSLLVGYFAHLYGADRGGFVPSSYIRFPIIFISALTSIMVFLIAKKAGGFWIGILAMFIYGAEPIMVFSSRSAMPETLIAFLFSLAVWLMLKYAKNPEWKYILPIPILAGIAGLAKPTGFFILGPALYIVVAKAWEKKILARGQTVQKLIYLLAVLLIFIGLYVWYGYYFDAEIFKGIISIQGFRPAGFNVLTYLFITPSFDTSVFRSGLYVFCLIFAVYFLLRPKNENIKIISLAFVYWLIIVSLSSGQYDLLAWYRFPALPFLAVFGALGVKYVWENPDFFVSFFTLGFFLGARTLLANDFRPNPSPMTYRLIISGALVPSFANMIFNKPWLKNLSRLVILFAVAAGMFWNIKYIYNAYELACESKSCPMVPTTFLSVLRYPFFWRFLVLK